MWVVAVVVVVVWRYGGLVAWRWWCGGAVVWCGGVVVWWCGGVGGVYGVLFGLVFVCTPRR